MSSKEESVLTFGEWLNTVRKPVLPEISPKQFEGFNIPNCGTLADLRANTRWVPKPVTEWRDEVVIAPLYWVGSDTVYPSALARVVEGQAAAYGRVGVLPVTLRLPEVAMTFPLEALPQEAFSIVKAAQYVQPVFWSQLDQDWLQRLMLFAKGPLVFNHADD